MMRKADDLLAFLNFVYNEIIDSIRQAYLRMK